MRHLRREGMLPSGSARGKHRPHAILVALALSILTTLMLSFEARAQIDPDDTGEGYKLGLAGEKNSGQTGTVTLLASRPGETLVVVAVASVPSGRREAALIRRSRSCRSTGPAQETALSSVVNGFSRTIVALATPRLLSGNYVVEIFAGPGGARVSCGELHG